MLNKKVQTSVSVGIPCVGNVTALNMCVASILNGNYVPGQICVLMNGDIPNINSFYLEQMVSLARFHGVKFRLHMEKCDGVREARDKLLDYCTTEILWMTDDDVLYDPHFL